LFKKVFRLQCILSYLSRYCSYNCSNLWTSSWKWLEFFMEFRNNDIKLGKYFWLHFFGSRNNNIIFRSLWNLWSQKIKQMLFMFLSNYSSCY